MSTKDAQGHEELPMTTDELLQGHLQLWNHAMGFVKSAALLCAMELRIPDAIVRCGGTATLNDLVLAIKLPTSNLPFLHRLMRALTASGIFTVRHCRPEGQVESTTVDKPAASTLVYELTAASRLLFTGVEGGSSFSLFPSIRTFIIPKHVSTILGMHDWIKHESATNMSTLMMAAGGKEVWERLLANPMARASFYDSMDADTGLITHAILKDHPAIFRGFTSLVDVGGGRGTAAAAIVMAFPNIKRTVIDLPHVIAEAPKDGANGLCFVAGDMFEHIPPAHAILLKWVLHDWDDDNCVNILRQCKKAISHREGVKQKVIIIDIVIGSRPNDVICKEAQVLSDIYFMNIVTGGTEREEHEWRRIFIEAGFSDYTITPLHGLPSVIEVYP